MKNRTALITLVILFITINSVAQKKESFTDSRDGKTYRSVKIGKQIWMAENLAFNSGDSGCFAHSYDTNNVATYGYLYTWETSKNVCPAGWHLPSNDEWATLVEYSGGEFEAGGKMKEPGTTRWVSPNNGATNKSAFTALAASKREKFKEFNKIGVVGNWWSSTEWGPYMSYFMRLYSNSIETFKLYDSKTNGYSVRCLKD
jgi:uncharacterized protein (TIGR02145 family)